jgi:hypothetical protein
MTTSKPKTAADLLEMFVASAAERGKVKDDGYNKSTYLSERQADWFLSLYEKEHGRCYFGGYIMGNTYSLIVGDTYYVFGGKSKNGSMQVSWYSISEREARSRNEMDARIIEAAREPGAVIEYYETRGPKETRPLKRMARVIVDGIDEGVIERSKLPGDLRGE